METTSAVTVEGGFGRFVPALVGVLPEIEPEEGDIGGEVDGEAVQEEGVAEVEVEAVEEGGVGGDVLGEAVQEGDVGGEVEGEVVEGMGEEVQGGAVEEEMGGEDQGEAVAEGVDEEVVEPEEVEIKQEEGVAEIKQEEGVAEPEGAVLNPPDLERAEDEPYQDHDEPPELQPELPQVDGHFDEDNVMSSTVSEQETTEAASSTADPGIISPVDSSIMLTSKGKM